MRILILGAGGVGGYFGARLIQAGADVTFLVRPARAAILARDGLIVRSPLGDVDTPVKTVTADGLKQDFDLILLSCKAYDLEEAIDAIAPAMAPQTGVVPLLNGVAHIDALRRRFGVDRVLGGVAQITATLEPSGVVRHLAPLCAIRFGRLGEIDPWTGALLEAFQRANVEAVRSDAIAQDMWDKFVFLATLAGSTCLMRASVGVILETAFGEEFISQLLSECEKVAAAEGRPPAEQALSRYRTTLGERGSPVTASMLRDVERGGRTEAEHVLGDLVRRAERHKISTPMLRVAYTHLQAYELRRKKA